MRAILAALAITVTVGFPAVAQRVDRPQITASEQKLAGDIFREMRLADLVDIMSQEALLPPDEPEADPLPAEEQKAWEDGLRRINAPDRLGDLLRHNLENELTGADPVLIGKALAFYDTPLGMRLVGLELSARAAMLAPDGEAAAREAVAGAAADNKSAATRLAMIDQLIVAGDVIDRNVAGNLNAMMATTRGFAQASGVSFPEAQATAEAWAQEPAIREDITQWVLAMLYLAYGPLSEAEMESFVAFARSPEGQALSDVLSDAFDQVFTRVAYETGMMSAGRFSGADL